MIPFPENPVFPTQQNTEETIPCLHKLGYYICVPFAFLTRLFYSWTGSYGVALILFTLVVKLVLLPFQLKSKKSMLRMNRMQGKMQGYPDPLRQQPGSVSRRTCRSCT